MAENVVESSSPSAKRRKLSSPAPSISASDGAGNGQGMMQGQVMNGSIGAGRGCSNMSYPNPGMGNADTLIAETPQQCSPQMGGQASLRGPQPGATNKDDDLGIAHNNTENPEHKMEKPGLGIDDESNNQQAAATQSHAYSGCLSLQRCIQSLVHACQCHNVNCSLPNCQMMKRVVQHTERCKRRLNGECPLCKQVIALSCLHATDCQEIKCPVVYCQNIKRKFSQQELQHRLQQAQMQRAQMVLFSGKFKSVANCQNCNTPAWGQQSFCRLHTHVTDPQDDDLGIARNNTENPEHKMEKPGLSVDDESNNQQAAATQSCADSGRLALQRCIQSLVHACQCHNVNCSLPKCQKMKRVVQHTERCKGKLNGECPLCKQLISLCYFHAKHCQEIKCPMVYCPNIKRKFRQQELQHRLQQAQMQRAQVLLRRMNASGG